MFFAVTVYLHVFHYLRLSRALGHSGWNHTDHFWLAYRIYDAVEPVSKATFRVKTSESDFNRGTLVKGLSSMEIWRERFQKKRDIGKGLSFVEIWRESFRKRGILKDRVVSEQVLHCISDINNNNSNDNHHHQPTKPVLTKLVQLTDSAILAVTFTQRVAVLLRVRWRTVTVAGAETVLNCKLNN